MYRHILIPTDGSMLSHHAVVHGLALAKAVSAKVTVIMVEPTIDVFTLIPSSVEQLPEGVAAYGKRVKDSAARVLATIADEAIAAGVSCETKQVGHNQPFQAILDMCRQKGCDLIVMASHGRSGMAGVVLGSVATKVLTHATVPVLVCH